jgi:hypothetical protein
MRDEQGVSMVELLTVLLVLSVVLGTALLFFSSLLKVTDLNTRAAFDDLRIKTAMHRVSQELAESSRVVFFPAQGELRLQQGSSVRAMYVDTNSSELVLCDFDEAFFQDGTRNPLDDAGLYTNARVLASGVVAAQFTLADGVTAVPSVPLGDGAMVNAQVTFTREERRGTVTQEVRSLQVKLMVDSTVK